MFVLSGSTLAILVLGGVCAFLAGKWLFTKDSEAEARKRAAIKVASTMEAMGLVRLPKLLECYAVNDWSGLAHEIKLMAELAVNEKALLAEFDVTFSRVLDMKLRSEEGRALLAAKLAATAAPTPAVA